MPSRELEPVEGQRVRPVQPRHLCRLQPEQHVHGVRRWHRHQRDGHVPVHDLSGRDRQQFRDDGVRPLPCRDIRRIQPEQLVRGVCGRHL